MGFNLSPLQYREYKYMTLEHKTYLYRSTSGTDDKFVFVLDAKNVVQSPERCELTSFLTSQYLPAQNFNTQYNPMGRSHGDSIQVMGYLRAFKNIALKKS